MLKLAAVALFILGLVIALARLPFEIVVTAMAIVGFLSSLFVLVTWTPYAISARMRSKKTLSYLSLLDFSVWNVLGTVVLAVRLWYSWKEGVPLPLDHIRAFVSVGIWVMIALASGIRAYAWFSTLRKYPQEQLRQYVADQTDHRL